jgi:hypothetical protein
MAAATVTPPATPVTKGRALPMLPMGRKPGTVTFIAVRTLGLLLKLRGSAGNVVHELIAPESPG